MVIMTVALIGIYLIGLQTGKIKIPKEVKDLNQEVQQEKVTQAIQPQVFDFEKANEIIVSDIREGKRLLIDEVKIEAAGFVVVYQSDESSAVNILGFSQLLPKGESKDVSIILKRTVVRGESIYLGLRIDDGDGFFEFSGRYDKNIQRADGKAILQKFIVGV